MKTAPVKERNIPRLGNLQETTEGQLRVLTNRWIENILEK